MGLGSKQKGKIFSVPRWSSKTENVTPWLSRAISASAWERPNSSEDFLPKVANALATGGRTSPSFPNTSSWVPGSGR